MMKPARVGACLLVVGLLAALPQIGHGTPRRHMPGVMGMTKAEALDRMAQHDLKADIVVDRLAVGRLSARQAGRIVHQTWRHGTALPEGSSVRLTLYPGRVFQRSKAD